MIRIIVLAIVLYSAAFALLFLGQNSLIYPFDPTRINPKDAGEPRLAEKALRTPDGQTLVVWVAASARDKPTIVYFHGNAGNLALRAQRFDRMLDRGYGLVAMAYRGSSGSTGSPSQAAIEADSIQLYAALPDLLGSQPKKIIFYGESLGTTVAVHLATKHPPTALILEAPFTSLHALAQQKLWFFPVALALRDTWDTQALMPGIAAPLLVLHGETDDVVPISFGLKVFEASPANAKVWFAAKNIGHLGLWSEKGQRAIYRFIDRF